MFLSCFPNFQTPFPCPPLTALPLSHLLGGLSFYGSLPCSLVPHSSLRLPPLPIPFHHFSLTLPILPPICPPPLFWWLESPPWCHFLFGSIYWRTWIFMTNPLCALHSQTTTTTTPRSRPCSRRQHLVVAHGETAVANQARHLCSGRIWGKERQREKANKTHS